MYFFDNIKSSYFSNSQFQDEYTLEQILESKAVHEPLTKLQCCPTSDGSAAALIASEDFVKAKGLENQVRISTVELSITFVFYFANLKYFRLLNC